MNGGNRFASPGAGHPASRPRPGAGAAPCSAGPTPWQTVGPFLEIGFGPLATSPDACGDVPELLVTGRVLDGAGDGVPDAVLESWHAGTAPRAGRVERELPEFFARSLTDARGAYELRTTRPVPRPGQAPHLELVVFARGLLRALRTRVYLPDDPEANDRDPVLCAVEDADRRATLVAAAEGDRYVFDVRLQESGGRPETVFFA